MMRKGAAEEKKGKKKCPSPVPFRAEERNSIPTLGEREEGRCEVVIDDTGEEEHGRRSCR